MRATNIERLAWWRRVRDAVEAEEGEAYRLAEEALLTALRGARQSAATDRIAERLAGHLQFVLFDGGNSWPLTHSDQAGVATLKPAPNVDGEETTVRLILDDESGACGPSEVLFFRLPGGKTRYVAEIVVRVVTA